MTEEVQEDSDPVVPDDPEERGLLRGVDIHLILKGGETRQFSDCDADQWFIDPEDPWPAAPLLKRQDCSVVTVARLIREVRPDQMVLPARVSVRIDVVDPVDDGRVMWSCVDHGLETLGTGVAKRDDWIGQVIIQWLVSKFSQSMPGSTF